MYNLRKLQMNKDQDELSKTRSLRVYKVLLGYSIVFLTMCLTRDKFNKIYGNSDVKN